MAKRMVSYFDPITFISIKLKTNGMDNLIDLMTEWFNLMNEWIMNEWIMVYFSLKHIYFYNEKQLTDEY